MADEDLFKISLDGRNADGTEINLDTVDPRLMLELAIAYVKALSSVAEDEDRSLGLRGLHTLTGSAVVAFATDDADATQDCAHTVNRLVGSPTAPGYIAPLRAIVQMLPGTMFLTVANQNWSEPVAVLQPHVVQREIISARVTVIRAGGATPAIRVEDVVKRKRFTVQTATPEQARELAQFLYRDIDIRAEVTRRPDGGYADGRLLKFTPLDEVEPLAAWREWFARHDEHWRGVSDADLSKALKRDGLQDEAEA